jgi:dihydroorotase
MAHYDLLVKGAWVIDPAQGLNGVNDIAIDDGRIVSLGDHAADSAAQSIDGSGLFASPGWIDLHVHVFDAGVIPFGINADREAGIATGVTTVVDAGSAGADSWNDFCERIIKPAKTRVYAYLNVSASTKEGPIHGSWDNFNQGKTIPLAEHLGIKVLASQRHCGNLGITPMKLARQASRLSGTGLMVHLGEAPPIIEDVLSLMDEGDVLTHCWKGVYGGLLGRDKKPLPETWAAVERGVKFDIGHGSASFSFETARYALDAGLPLHAISTDLHRGNVNEPVYDMATTMTKFLHLGFDLPEVIRLCTLSPAQLIHREHEIGSLQAGRVADITLFHLAAGEFPVTDAERKREIATQKLVVDTTIRAGKVVQKTQE